MAIPPYLTLSWFAVEHRYAAGASVAHHADRRDCLGLVLHADARIRSITPRRETAHDLRPGMVGVVPADHAAHTVLVAPRGATAAFLLLVPPEAVRDIGHAEGIDCGSDVPEEFAFDDPLLARLLARLQRHREADPSIVAAESTAREAILRVFERATGRRPAWRFDTSSFARGEMERIVAYIDGTLADAIGLGDIARVTGLSPSHFERKFRLSTGMSAMRFRTGRRIRHALDLLQKASEPLPELSTRLGFCSHSHFTRTFRAWTGMTPLRYLRAFRPAGGSGPPRNGTTPPDGYPPPRLPRRP